jgi:SAM-dependent methyltransferase
MFAGHRIPVRSFARELPHQPPADGPHLASGALYERLTAEDVAMVEREVEGHPDLRALMSHAAHEHARRELVLAFGFWLKLPGLPERTGLLPQQPPDDIHAMARGPLAAAGGLYEADLVADALASAGVDVGSVERALDFGCSSGRVIRVLAAAYPGAEWQGCDPNDGAIAWAHENLRHARFFVSPQAPPLDVAPESLDLAYAISIWSHFEPQLGLSWFEEMRRILRPGAHLVFTTHGLTSVAHYFASGLRSAEQAGEIADGLYRDGYWYAAEFGKSGDWGVVNPSWGTAFLSPEWVLTQLCPRWRVLEFAPGRNQHNQDVYVLQRM